ncbi:MAG: ATP-grasp domain-containing protein [Burkholderiaceae bacterium]|nr:ATP-grasp domain-containing protein [Burkholderiaceae bacterium]
MSFSTILIANRGEIACRVIRTAHRLGYRTVAVCSDADAGAPHVRLADAAVRIGPAPAAGSYLSIEALLAAARASGADAVHPGYGFLSERADFAEACVDAGLVFIGPPPAAIRAMGGKAEAKRLMLVAGVPCAPGYLGEAQDDATLRAEGQRLGLPLLVKAVAGGGGRGMRLVRDWADWPEAVAGARREAASAFGDATLMLERLVEQGRHIEVQVFGDTHGRVVHLGERDCTAQRRRQKVVEEAPSPVVGAALREAMGRDAVAAARAVGYVGAGTVEFIVDAAMNHYFLEMNTRLQVEHPVTECVTGLDLVEWQLRVAAGEPLPLTQEQVRLDGHAIELRLYAEDPAAGWVPQTGTVRGWRPERAQACGVRVDHGLAEGQLIGPHYDAMVAKFIAHGRTRADAVRRLLRALEQAPLLAPANNGRFLHELLRHPDFTAAAMTTERLDEWAAAGAAPVARAAPPEAAWRVAAALRAHAAAGGSGHRPASVRGFDLALQCQGERRTLRAPVPGVVVQAWDGLDAVVAVDGVERRVVALADGATLRLAWEAAVFAFDEPSPWPAATAAADPRELRAPVAGVVAQVAVQPGERVAAGQPLVCVEAMKMEMWQSAAAAGTVAAVHVAPRDTVAAGARLLTLEIDP